MKREVINRCASGTVTELHIDEWNEEMFSHSFQPMGVLQTISDDAARFRSHLRHAKGGSKIYEKVGVVPVDIDRMWQKEFQDRGHRYWTWDTFITMKLNDYNNRAWRVTDKTV